MLAYVFWHWPSSNIDDASYRKLLQNFHQTLNANAPKGFLCSIAFAVSQLPLLTNSQRGFEDWYLLEDSASLDILNEAAVSGVCEEPHNLVARQAADGTAGLYSLRAGQEELGGARYATWFSKPAGVPYQDLYSSLTPITSKQGIGLWQRQMTLGQTTEFAIYSAAPVELPEIKTNKTLDLECVWAKQ